MQTSTFKESGRSHTIDFRAIRPMQTKPKIHRHVNPFGIPHYEATDGKIYKAETFDKIFGKPVVQRS